MKCFVCEQEVQENPLCGIDDAGYINFSFGYGSRHDQIGCSKNSDKFIERLLSSEEIQAVICDDCFEKKQHLCSGYNVEFTRNRTKVC